MTRTLSTSHVEGLYRPAHRSRQRAGSTRDGTSKVAPAAPHLPAPPKPTVQSYRSHLNTVITVHIFHTGICTMRSFRSIENSTLPQNFVLRVGAGWHKPKPRNASGMAQARTLTQIPCLDKVYKKPACVFCHHELRHMVLCFCLFNQGTCHHRRYITELMISSRYNVRRRRHHPRRYYAPRRHAQSGRRHRAKAVPAAEIRQNLPTGLPPSCRPQDMGGRPGPGARVTCRCLAPAGPCRSGTARTPAHPRARVGTGTHARAGHVPVGKTPDILNARCPPFKLSR